MVKSTGPHRVRSPRSTPASSAASRRARRGCGHSRWARPFPASPSASASTETELVLTGRHVFSTYELTFRLRSTVHDRTEIRAESRRVLPRGARPAVQAPRDRRRDRRPCCPAPPRLHRTASGGTSARPCRVVDVRRTPPSRLALALTSEPRRRGGRLAGANLPRRS